MTVERCPNCGKNHEAPFSAEVLALARRILRSEDTNERESLLMQLVEIYTDNVDLTDLTLPEDLHGLIDAFLDARAMVTSEGMKLGRMLLRAVGSYDSHRANSGADEPDAESETKEDTDRLN